MDKDLKRHDDLLHGEEMLNPGISEEEYRETFEEPEYDIDDFEQDEQDEKNEKEKLTCPVCGKEIKFLSKRRVVKGLYICGDCENKSAINRYTKEIKKYSPQDALNIVLNKIEKAENFTVSKSADGYFLVDDKRMLWTVPYAATMIKNTPKIDPELIFGFDEIESYEFIEDGNLLAKGGRGLKKIGGLLFGSEGGGFSANSEDRNTCENLQVKINLSNLATPKVFINLIFKEIDKDKKAYGQAFLTAQKILSMLELICHKDDAAKEEAEKHEADKEKSAAGSLSPADEIKKYKELLDMGAITQEEYDAKKAKLLDL